MSNRLCDFFLLGYMKELVYKPLPTRLLQFEEKITLSFKNIPEPMVQKLVDKSLMEIEISIYKKMTEDKELINNYDLSM